ncbi:MAG: H(+)-transporting ATPase [Clostridia bacterium]|nr:H(+)-transporting ATPase [Clostridia bacterium]
MNVLKKRITPGRLIALGFAMVILLGTVLLFLPVSHKPGAEVSFTDALFTATSAVCVTGLLTVDAGSVFSAFGQVVLLFLIQIGGLGITSIGVGILALTGQRLNFRERLLIKEALNYPTLKGVWSLIRLVLGFTLGVELAGAAATFCILIREYSVGRAAWLSVFHSITAFNNAGIDVFGRGDNLIPYAYNVPMNLVTCALIILGGIGFFVVRDLWMGRRTRRYTLHTRVVVAMTAVLLVAGTVLIKITEGDGITWLGAFFASVTARTAGFSTFSFGEFTRAGLLVMIVLMFIGASPGSTGGGMKTTTVFVALAALRCASTNHPPEAFRRRIPDEAQHKAFVVLSLGLIVVLAVSALLCVLEPEYGMADILFETVSAVATVGLSTGITPELGTAARIVLVLTMYIGRLGPLTIASLWVREPDTGVSLPEENLPIG